MISKSPAENGDQNGQFVDVFVTFEGVPDAGTLRLQL